MNIPIQIPYVLYILQCSDGTYYTGITTDPERRLLEHNTSSKGAKYTRSRRPLDLVYQELCVDKRSALRREREIKKMDRAQKRALIASKTL